MRSCTIGSVWLNQFLALLPPSSSVLELGCGTGLPIAKYFSEQGISFTGVDTLPKLLAGHSSFHLRPEDQWKIFVTFAQHAPPGAELMFTSRPQYAPARGKLAGERLYPASLDAYEYQAVLSQHGFKVVQHVKKMNAVTTQRCGSRNFTAIPSTLLATCSNAASEAAHPFRSTRIVRTVVRCPNHQ
jgi:SAM-dependent methyltransferase